MPESRGAPNDGQTLDDPRGHGADAAGLCDRRGGAGRRRSSECSRRAIRPTSCSSRASPWSAPRSGTPIISQASTGNLVWSDDRQLRVNAVELYDASTMTFQLPAIRALDLQRRHDDRAELRPRRGADRRRKVGGVRRPGRRQRQRPACGATPSATHDLAAGDHTLTLTAIGTRNGQFRIGLDLMRLAAAALRGPTDVDAVASGRRPGRRAVYGWSTDRPTS